MNVEKILHMVGGAGEFSYAANSKLQEMTILRIRPMLEEAVGDMHINLLQNKMVAADLGCSSGPNTFLVMSQVIKIVSKGCQRLEVQPPEMQLFLNDLPGNDFNSIFQSLDSFEERVQADKTTISVPYFVAGLPGSYFGRLFPSQSVHFFHSSYSLHWLSQIMLDGRFGFVNSMISDSMEGMKSKGPWLLEVPEGLENKIDNEPLNKGNINIGRTSPPLVAKLYQEQFKKDFSQFLKMRFDELVSEGQMIMTLMARKKDDIYSDEFISFWDLFSETLSSLIIEGLVEKEKLDCFQMPVYRPSMKEANDIIKAEDLFDILHIQILEFKGSREMFGDSNDDFVFDHSQSGKISAMCLRAAFGPIIASHFGAAVVDELFSRIAINLAKRHANKAPKLAVLALSLRKKERM